MFKKNLAIIFASGALAIGTVPLAFSQGEQGSDSQSAMQSQASQSSKKGEMGSKHVVRKAQEALQQKGIDPGPIDGIMGPKTKKAITEFQRQQNMKASGVLDSQTKDALGVGKQGASNVSGEEGNREKPEATAPSEQPNQNPEQQLQPNSSEQQSQPNSESQPNSQQQSQPNSQP